MTSVPFHKLTAANDFDAAAKRKTAGNVTSNISDIWSACVQKQIKIVLQQMESEVILQEMAKLSSLSA